MATDYSTLKRLYENNKFAELLELPDGVYWLKLRSLSSSEILRELCKRVNLDCSSVPGSQLLSYIYEAKPDETIIDKFIRELYQVERAVRRKNEDYLISQLYQMKVFDWGGLYQNSLERTIVNNYVKKIQNWDSLNSSIENELLSRMKGYVQCSWYNHWSSIIIEDIFKDHRIVLPTVGLVKKVDFFIYDFPFDLKVTYFPDEYMKQLRGAEGLRPEFTELKMFFRSMGIWFDRSQPEGVLFPELLTKISEHPSPEARRFITDFKATRARLISRP